MARDPADHHAGRGDARHPVRIAARQAPRVAESLRGSTVSLSVDFADAARGQDVLAIARGAGAKRIQRPPARGGVECFAVRRAR